MKDFLKIKGSLDGVNLDAIMEKNSDYFGMIKSGFVGVKSIRFGKDGEYPYMDTFNTSGKLVIRYWVHPDYQLSIKKPE